MCVAGAGFGADLGADPGRAQGLRADERDHHDADAQLRRRADHQLPDLRQPLVLARHEVAQRRGLPQGQSIPERAFWPVATLTNGHGGVLVPLGMLVAAGVAAALWVLYRHTRFGFEVQVIGDSPRAAHYAGMRMRRKILAVMALSGGIAGVGGAAQAGNFDHLLDPRWTPAVQLRLLGDRRRRTRPLQPVRRHPGRRPARRPAERRLRPPGHGLPVRPRRRDAGHLPVLRARRRAARPVPDSLRPRAPGSQSAGFGAGGGRVNNGVARRAARLRDPLRHAAALRRARRAAGRAGGRAQPRSPGDDARRRGDGLLDRPARRRRLGSRSGAGDRGRRARRAR